MALYFDEDIFNCALDCILYYNENAGIDTYKSLVEKGDWTEIKL